MLFITIDNKLAHNEAVGRVEKLFKTHLMPKAYAQRGIKGAALWLNKNLCWMMKRIV